MRRILVWTLAAAVTATCSAAQAADDIRYVSTSGNNNDACSLAAPCRSLQRAIGVTPAGGDIHILDSGFYGNNATIKKSLTISGNGHTVFLGNPIVIDQADAVVALRGFTLDGRRTVAEGIRIAAAAAVHIERCVIQAFSNHGIVSFGVTETRVFITGSSARDNGGNGAGIAGVSRLTVDHSHFESNGISGITILGGIGTINRSTASGNRFDGIDVSSNASVGITATVAARNGSNGFRVGGGASIIVDSSVAHGNRNAGLFATSAVARISNTTFTGNEFGIRSNAGGTLETRGNNSVRGNTTNVSGTRTPIDGV